MSDSAKTDQHTSDNTDALAPDIMGLLAAQSMRRLKPAEPLHFSQAWLRRTILFAVVIVATFAALIDGVEWPALFAGLGFGWMCLHYG